MSLLSDGIKKLDNTEAKLVNILSSLHINRSMKRDHKNHITEIMALLCTLCVHVFC
jgi:hemerythrin